MLEPQDIQKLMEVLATKEDFRDLEKRFDGVDAQLVSIDTRFDGVDTRLDSIDTRLEGVDARLDGMDGRFDTMDLRLMNLETSSVVMSRIVESLDDRMTVLDEKQDRVITILDKMIGRMEALNQEYLVLKDRDSRYERWFLQIAEKVGVTLTP